MSDCHLVGVTVDSQGEGHLLEFGRRELVKEITEELLLLEPVEALDLGVLVGLVLSALVIFIIVGVRGIGGIVVVVKVGIVIELLTVRHVLLGVVAIDSMVVVGLDFDGVLVLFGWLLWSIALLGPCGSGRLCLGLASLLLLDRWLVPLAEHIVDLPDARVGGGEGVGLDVLPLLLLEAEVLDEDPEEVGVLGQALAPGLDPLAGDEALHMALDKGKGLIVKH